MSKTKRILNTSKTWYNCPIPACEDNYISETTRHKKDQNGRNIMIMWLEKTLKSLLRTLKTTNGDENYHNHSTEPYFIS